jgi:uncharacterized protein YutE (UPF0331/DUF86 family)
MVDKGLQAYLNEIEFHLKDYHQQLDELHADLMDHQLNQRDYRAAERLLQLYTEVCIGLAKHWVKKLNQVAPVEAYQSFKYLAEKQLLTTEELVKWRKIIGMRNGLVHDYLNIDLSIVENIIKEKNYKDLSIFAKISIKALKE